MADIKVRVGQADAIRVLSSAERSSSAFSVNGGTANVTALTVSGHSKLNTLNVTDLATFNSSDNPSIEGITVDGFNEKIKVGIGVTITNGNIFAQFLANFGSLNISGDSTFNGLVDINAGGRANTFTVENLTSGRVVLAGTSGQLIDNTNLTFSGSLLSIGVNLDVDGQTDLDVLNVAETATFAGNINANGNLDVDGQTDLDVLNVAETATFVGNINANGNLDVDGQTELDDVNISGITTFAGNINANGNLDVDGQTDLDVLNVSDTATFAGNIIATGEAELNNLNIVGIVSFSEGTNFDTEGNLAAAGRSTLNTLLVTGIATFTSSIDANGDLDVDGHTELDNLGVSGIATFTSSIDANGDLDVDGHAELDNVNISGVSTFVGISTFQNNVFIDGSLTAGLLDGGSF